MHVQWDSSFAVLSEGRKLVELLILGYIKNSFGVIG
jgi:hypothetical protein